MKVEVRQAKGFILLWMSILGWWAMAKAPNRIYIRLKKGMKWDEVKYFIPVETIRHEVTHLMQFIKYGFRYDVIYWTEFFTKGYKNIRFEVEARAAENNPDIKFELNYPED